MRGVALLTVILVVALIAIVVDRQWRSIPSEISAAPVDRQSCLSILRREPMTDHDERRITACLLAGALDESDLQRRLDEMRKN
jgi:hypothetical protein